MRPLALGVVAATLLAGCQVDEDAQNFPFVDVAVDAGLVYHVNENYDASGGMTKLMESVTGGLAIGDFDNDGWLDVYVNDDGPNALFRNLGDGRFEDVTQRMGVRDDANGRGALFFDYDNDGWQDLYVVNFQEPNRLFKNLGGRTFRDVTTESGTGLTSTGHAAAAADIDGDDDLDLVVANYGDFRMRNPDFYVMAENGERNFLFRNDGNGRFTEVADAQGLAETRWSFQVAFVDYDLDGDDDLWVCNDFGYDALYRNNRGRFTDVSQFTGIVSNRSCMGAAIADFDLDGRFDIFVPNIYAPGTPVPANEGNFLWHQLADGRFEEVAKAWGLQDSLWSWGPVAFDADSDGDLDLFVVNGMSSIDSRDGWYDATFDLAPTFNPAKYPTDHAALPVNYNQSLVMVRVIPKPPGSNDTIGMAINQPDRLFLNEGPGRFREVAAAWGLDFRDDGRSAAAFDYDRDGDLDLIMTSRDMPVRLLENRAPQGHWLQLSLKGTRGHAEAIGAIVKVHVEGAVLLREKTAGDGFMAQSSPVLHFGLGNATKADLVEIRWPSGVTETFEDVAADRIYRAVEGTDDLATSA